MAEERDMNLDPLTNEPVAHPVGTGLGTAGGAVAGAAAGSLAGPAGTVVGGLAGAVAGGLAGKAVAEKIDPTAEEAYWRESFRDQPYYRADRSYDDYGPAYELGWTSYATYGGPFERVESRLASDWELRRGGSGLSWSDAAPATRAARERVSKPRPPVAGADDADVVSVLNDLIENCRDGQYGFQACAEHAKSEQLKSTLARRATECGSAAAELESHVRRLGGDPDRGGTVSGALHRGWVAVRATLSTYDDLAVLEECERGEDAALARYRKALKENLPTVVRTVVQSQFEGAQRNHDQIKSMRDRAKAAGRAR